MRVIPFSVSTEIGFPPFRLRLSWMISRKFLVHSTAYGNEVATIGNSWMIDSNWTSKLPSANAQTLIETVASFYGYWAMRKDLYALTKLPKEAVSTSASIVFSPPKTNDSRSEDFTNFSISTPHLRDCLSLYQNFAKYAIILATIIAWLRCRQLKTAVKFTF